MFVFFFFKSPAPTPLKITFLSPLCLSVFFWALNFLVLRGYCSAGSRQLGTDYNRALCPAPVSCVCHALILNISLLLPFSSRHSGKPQQNHFSRPVLDGPGFCASGSGPLHTCTILFVCLSFMPPHFVPCFLTPHFFFSAPPPHGPLF